MLIAAITFHIPLVLSNDNFNVRMFSPINVFALNLIANHTGDQF